MTTESTPKKNPLWLASLQSISSTLNRVAAVIAAVCLIGMVSLILLEIVLRFFSLSTFMTDAIVGYGVAATTMLAMPWTLEKGSMIRVSVLLALTSGLLRRLLELFAIVSTFSIIGLIAIFVWRQLSRDFLRGATSEHYFPIPLWIPDAIFFTGMVLLLLLLLIKGLALVTLGEVEDESTSI